MVNFWKFDGFYHKNLLRAHPDKMFIFGDNLKGYGKGGQAAIRGESNAFGIPTKVSPSNDPDAFFLDENIDQFINKVVTKLDYVKSLNHRHPAGGVVVPFTPDGKISLGLGLAQLNETSPTTYALICQYFEAMVSRNGGWKILEG